MSNTGPSVNGAALAKVPLRATTGLFLALFAFYGLTGPGHLSSVDGKVLLESARNLLATGSGAVSRDRSENSEGITPRGIDGRFYPVWGPGLALAHVPTLVAVRLLGFLRPTTEGRPVSAEWRDQFYAPFTCAWLMAAAVTTIALCACALGFPFRVGLALATLMAAGSPLWHYARFDTNEPLQCVSLIGATFCLVRARHAHGARYAFVAGVFLGLAVAAKAENVIVLPWFFLYAARTSAPPRAPVLAGLAIPIAIAGAAIAALNQSRYGSPFETGYHLGTARLLDHPFLDGAYVLLFSPGFGLAVFWPALVLLPFAAVIFVRRFAAESMLITAVFVSHLVIDAKFYAYWGCAWGPRFLVPTVPLLALVLLPLMAESGWRRRLLVASLVTGIGIQVVTISTAFWGQVIEVWGNLAVAVKPPVAADPRAASIERVETLIHSASAAPPVVALWLLRNTGCRMPGEPPPELSIPPWHESFPWQDAASPERLADLVGLDLWIVPPCWRPQRFAAVLPSNPRLFWTLVAVGGVGLGLLAHDWRQGSDPPEHAG